MSKYFLPHCFQLIQQIKIKITMYIFCVKPMAKIYGYFLFRLDVKICDAVRKCYERYELLIVM